MYACIHCYDYPNCRKLSSVSYSTSVISNNVLCMMSLNPSYIRYIEAFTVLQSYVCKQSGMGGSIYAFGGLHPCCKGSLYTSNDSRMWNFT